MAQLRREKRDLEALNAKTREDAARRRRGAATRVDDGVDRGPLLAAEKGALQDARQLRALMVSGSTGRACPRQMAELMARQTRVLWILRRLTSGLTAEEMEADQDLSGFGDDDAPGVGGPALAAAASAGSPAGRREPRTRPWTTANRATEAPRRTSLLPSGRGSRCSSPTPSRDAGARKMREERRRSARQASHEVRRVYTVYTVYTGLHRFTRGRDMYYYTIRTYSSYVVTRVANVVVSRRVVVQSPSRSPICLSACGAMGATAATSSRHNASEHHGQVHDQRAVSDAGDAPGQRRVRLVREAPREQHLRDAGNLALQHGPRRSGVTSAARRRCRRW